MKRTYIFIVADGVTEQDLYRLAVVLRNRSTMSYKISHINNRYDRVQVFTVPSEMHQIAHAAGFSGAIARVIIATARRRGDAAVGLASKRLDNLRRRPLVPSAVRKEDKSEDTILLDWLEKNQALINVPNTTAEWPMAHVSCRTPNGGTIHHYDTSYRSVIRRAMRHYSTPMQMPGGTKRSKRSA